MIFLIFYEFFSFWFECIEMYRAAAGGGRRGSLAPQQPAGSSSSRHSPRLLRCWHLRCNNAACVMRPIILRAATCHMCPTPFVFEFLNIQLWFTSYNMPFLSVSWYCNFSSHIHNKENYALSMQLSFSAVKYTNTNESIMKESQGTVAKPQCMYCIHIV